MTEVTESDGLLIERNVELELRFEQDSKLIKGYRNLLGKYETEAKINDHTSLALNNAQNEIISLRKELGR